MTTTPEQTVTLAALVAAEVRAMMGRLDVRQAELARRLGENDQWLSIRLRGRAAIDINDLHRIARALGVGIHDLLPAPEVANRAAPPSAIARYLEEPARTTSVSQHRPHSRPPGQVGHTRPHTVPRTARLPRPHAA